VPSLPRPPSIPIAGSNRWLFSMIAAARTKESRPQRRLDYSASGRLNLAPPVRTVMIILICFSDACANTSLESGEKYCKDSHASS